MEKHSIIERTNNWIRRSITIKLLSIAILVLILLIPSSMLQSLIFERQQLHDDVLSEISSKWGGQQTIGGPVLSIPYRSEVKDDKGNIEYVKRYAHFLPDELNINGEIIPEIRNRRIYTVVVYKSEFEISGRFSFPDVREAGLEPSDCFFKEAVMSVGITDLKGINNEVSIRVNDTSFSCGPGLPVHDILQSGISFKYPLKPAKEFSFTTRINLNGSTAISFLPFGKQTIVTLKSPWNSPGFEGSFLPQNRTVTDTGFYAQWKVLQLNRNYPQQGTGSFIDSENNSEFGLRLIIPVDEYQKNIRSVKYCIMFIMITFLAFFFIEVVNKKRIHPVQYLIVGSAVCLFYILLLSLSEHISFGYSYLISCSIIITMITLYVKYIFQRKSLTYIFSGLMIILYGFFYSLLQLEDYALLMGSAGMVVMLATIMYLTRKVNWYGDEIQGEN